MPPQKKQHPPEKTNLHARSKHRERYDFKALTTTCPELKQYVVLTPFRDESIDFFNPEAVKMLNKALLMHHYGITWWDIPANYLCPPIPGRAEYIHYMADLLQAATPNDEAGKDGAIIRCLDIGVGANCIYPIIGASQYNWQFVGADCDAKALASAARIVEQNDVLSGRVALRLQTNKQHIFQGIIQPGERFDLTICNPPFHASLAEAQAGTLRKLSNLKGKKVTQPVTNFGGQQNELWCEGGEAKFVETMIVQSQSFANSCRWFSTLIAKQAHLESLYATLKRVGAVQVKTLPLQQGNKASRILAWSFLTPEQQRNW